MKIKCPHCGKMVGSLATKCWKCGGVLKEEPLDLPSQIPMMEEEGDGQPNPFLTEYPSSQEHYGHEVFSRGVRARTTDGTLREMHISRDLYSQPPQTPKLRFDLLISVFLHPRETFIELYPQTTIVQGLIMALIMICISVTFSFLVDVMTATTPLALALILMIIPVVIIVGIVVFIIIAVITTLLADGRSDFGMTISLMGYASVVGVFWSIVELFAALILLGILLSTGGDIETLLGGAFVFLIIVVIAFIWDLWVNGHAVSVANDISFTRGLISYFAAKIILWIAIFLISLWIALSSLTLAV